MKIEQKGFGYRATYKGMSVYSWSICQAIARLLELQKYYA